MCLGSLIAFYNEVVGLVDKRRRVNVIYLSFIKAFDAICLHNILMEKLMKYGLDKWTAR